MTSYLVEVDLEAAGVDLGVLVDHRHRATARDGVMHFVEPPLEAALHDVGQEVVHAKRVLHRAQLRVCVVAQARADDVGQLAHTLCRRAEMQAMSQDCESSGVPVRVCEADGMGRCLRASAP